MSSPPIRVARPHLPRPHEAGTEVVRYGELTHRQRRLLHRDFERRVLPALTPMAFDSGHPFPRVSNRSISLAVMLRDPGHGERLGSVTVPGMFPRLWRIPGQPESGKFVRLEEMVAANVDPLFPGLEVVSTTPFRVTRKTRIAASSDGAVSRLPPSRADRDQRRRETVLRLEVERGMPRRTRDLLIRNLGIQPDQAVAVEGPLR